ncbi:TIGR03758 family integrating conjugative element protein [Billgrantia lactosivorans]|uniref:TIGR03758 family integrating conjugative element protein n=1 Tax=Billgrantia lactosivorans TaxID=2185141 RepID=UPI000DABB4DC|nr:TIGR03758 family integrating conjugative element protein [Halomonas lactosivorans]
MDSTAAFETGSGFEISGLYLLLAGVGCVAILLWAAWAAISAYRGWAKGNVKGDVFAGVAVRLLLLILIFIWLFV